MPRISDLQLLGQIQDPAMFGPPVVRATDKRLYRYKEGVWLPDGELEIASRVAQYLPAEEVNVSYIERCIKLATREFPTFNLDAERPETRFYVNASDCVVDVTGHPDPRRLPHDPYHYFLAKVPHDFDPKATCPNIDAALSSTFSPEMVDFMHEVFGYALLPQFNVKRAFLFYSRFPDAGKSMWLKVLQHLVGYGNYSTVSLQQLADDRFMRANLQHKLINVSGDLSDRAASTSAYFKQLTGGDWLTVERKGQDSFNMRNTAKLFFAGNDYPASEDQGEAYVRRWIVVPFTVRHKFDPKFEERIITGPEMQGLLAHAIRGAKRLVDRGDFALPQEVKDASHDYILELDTVQRWLEEGTKEAPDKRMAAPDAYRMYKEWAQDAGYMPLGPRKFRRRIIDRGVLLQRSNGKDWIMDRQAFFPGTQMATDQIGWLKAGSQN